MKHHDNVLWTQKLNFIIFYIDNNNIDNSKNSIDNNNSTAFLRELTS